MMGNIDIEEEKKNVATEKLIEMEVKEVKIAGRG